MSNEHLRSAGLDVLAQGLGLLKTHTPASYTQTLPQAFNASIGGHYRHCLDHFECLLTAPGGTIDYDARRRDGRVERNPAFAAERTHALIESLRTLPAARLDATVKVRCKVAYGDAESPLVPSTMTREIMYARIPARQPRPRPALARTRHGRHPARLSHLLRLGYNLQRTPSGHPFPVGRLLAPHPC